MHLETSQNRRMTGVMSDTGYIWIDKIKEIRSLIHIKYQSPVRSMCRSYKSSRLAVLLLALIENEIDRILV